MFQFYSLCLLTKARSLAKGLCYDKAKIFKLHPDLTHDDGKWISSDNLSFSRQKKYSRGGQTYCWWGINPHKKTEDEKT